MDPDQALDALMDLCGDITASWLNLTYFLSDAGIALAYFSIPIQLLIVLRDRRKDLPYPWLWIMFVLFITACGVTHGYHAVATLTIGETWSEAVIRVFTASISIATAIALALLIPQIRKIKSPAEMVAHCEKLVEERTAELQQAVRERDHVMMEMIHRAGNIAQVAESVVRIRENSELTLPRRRALTTEGIERMRTLATDAAVWQGGKTDAV